MKIQWSHSAPRYVTKKRAWGLKARGGYGGFKPLICLWKYFMHVTYSSFLSLMVEKCSNENPDIHLFLLVSFMYKLSVFLFENFVLLFWHEPGVQGRRRLKKWLISNQSIYWQVDPSCKTWVSAGRRKWKKSEIAQLWLTVCHPMDCNLPEEPGGLGRATEWIKFASFPSRKERLGQMQ